MLLLFRAALKPQPACRASKTLNFQPPANKLFSVFDNIRVSEFGTESR